MSLLPVHEALSRLLALAPKERRMEIVNLAAAEGRVLAHDVAARLTHPAFDNSAMDGYAGRHEDLAETGAELRVVGQSAAGHGFAGKVAAGEVVRIFTGAPIPAGADTVLAQEDAEPLGDGRIRTHFALTKGRHVRPKGQDFTEGDVILRAGETMTPARLTVAAAMNHPTLPVITRPKVAILATGDELLPPGSTPGADQIIASNNFGVAAIARQNGAEVIDLGILRDDRVALAAALNEAARDCDLILTTGGVSAGEEDHVRAAIESIGSLVLWRMAIKPGRPVAMGVIDGTPFIGLPGDPVAGFVTFTYVARPAILTLAGTLPTTPVPLRARAEFDYRKKAGRREYVRVTLKQGNDGLFGVGKFPRDGAGLLSSLVQTDGLVELGEDVSSVKSGDMLNFLPYSSLL